MVLPAGRGVGPVGRALGRAKAALTTAKATAVRKADELGVKLIQDPAAKFGIGFSAGMNETVSPGTAPPPSSRPEAIGQWTGKIAGLIAKWYGGQ